LFQLFLHIGCVWCLLKTFLHRSSLAQSVMSTAFLISKLSNPASWKFEQVVEKKC
jgi:hypothetical protein